MGVFSDLLAAPKTFAADGSVAARLLRYSQQQGDPSLPAAFQAADAVQEIAEYESNPTDGTFDLIFSGPGYAFTVADLAHDADADAIQDAVDTAAAGAIPGYTAGDIVVSGGGDGSETLEDGPIEVTFSGESVAESGHYLIVFDGSGLTGGEVADPAVTVTTQGQGDRQVWAILTLLGVLSGDPLPIGDEGPAVAGPNLVRVAPWFIKELAQEAAFEDGHSASYRAIMGIFVADKAPLVVD